MNTRPSFPQTMLLTATLLLSCAAFAQSTPEGTHLPVANSILPVEVFVESPAAASGDLQIICLFSSKPENQLLASLALLDQHLGGALASARSPQLFRGDLGETLLLEPKPGGIAAKRLLIIGLGDRPSFTPQREELVGEIVYTESTRLGVAAPSFAPTVLDGGASGFDTGAVGAEFLRGFLRGRDIAIHLHDAGVGPAPSVQRLTFLAGTAHALDTRKGLAAVLNPATTKAP
jgi:hypothetical protein